MIQTDLIREAKEQEMARYNEVMALLADLEQHFFFSHGLQEENWQLKQLANHNDLDCRSYADTERQF